MENNKDIFFDINLINDIIDGLADKKTEGEFFEHIKECSKCRRTYEEALRIRAVMKEDGFIPGTEDLPGEEFTVKTMEKIRAAKKPVIIRIINHPAVKTVTAAVACLLIAVFVFRSDLFGRIEGENKLADDMIVQQDIVMKNTGSDQGATPETGNIDLYTDSYSDEIVTEDCEDTVAKIEESTTYSYSPDGGSSGAGSASTSSASSSGATQSDSAEEKSYNTTITEAVNDESTEEIIEEVEDAMEEPFSETTTVTTADIEAEDAIEEPEVEESVECETEAADDAAAPVLDQTVEEDAIEEEVESPEYVTIVTGESVDEFFSDAVNDFLYFDIPDSDTEEKIKQIASSSAVRPKLDAGAYCKIVFIPYSSDEDLDWQGINERYTNRFIQTDSIAHDGYIYNVYECTVSEDNDIVLELFAGYACEIFPDVSADYSNEMTYLIIEQTK